MSFEYEMGKLEEDIKQQHFASEQMKAGVNVLYTANWLHNLMSSALKPSKLSHEQFNVLRILRGSHPKSMCQKDILSRMIAPNSNITLLVKKLSEKDLIQVSQSERDRREYVINISQHGLNLLSELDVKLQARAGDLNKLSDSEAFHLNALLDKMRT